MKEKELLPQNLGYSTHGDALDICKACGSHCCKFGGAIATRNEVEAITAMGYPDLFTFVSDDVFITEWKDDMTCPYLKEAECEIYEVRPLRCRAFPVFQSNSGDVFLSQCPIASLLANEDVNRMARKLSDCPIEIVHSASNFLEPYTKILERKISRFEKTEI